MSESLTEVLLEEEETSEEPVEPVHVVKHDTGEFPQPIESLPASSHCPPYVVYLAVIIYAVVASSANRGILGAILKDDTGAIMRDSFDSVTCYVAGKKFSKDASNIFEKNGECLRIRTESMEVVELWSKIPMIVNQCSQRRFLRIRGYSNRDEIKVHVMPSEDAFLSEFACSIITLGVGRDIQVESKMKEDMPLCSFYGADPIREPNKELYEEVGTFYHIAVGGKNGTSEATVLEPDTRNYRIREVRHVDIATFLRTYIRKQIIDQLMVDIEWDEYDLLPYLLRSGDIESTNVVICQLNIELHKPNFAQKTKFFEFFEELLEDARYMPLVADTMLGHIRLYLLNHEHPECRRRYIEAL